MAVKLFVGGLAPETTSEGLRAFFEQVGQVESAHVVCDRYGFSREFGFVEMATRGEAYKAMQELQGKLLDGRAVSVSVAWAQQQGNERRARGSGVHRR